MKRQLKRDHIAKIEGDILDEDHVDWETVIVNGQLQINATFYPFGKPKSKSK